MAAACTLSCAEQHGLVLSVRARSGQPRVETYDIRIKDIAGNALVLERLGEKIDAGRDISQEGQELRIAIELGGPGNYLVHIVASPGGAAPLRQFALMDFAVQGLTERSMELLLLVRDLDGDGLPACGPPSWLQCGLVSCRFLDCDDTDGEVHPFATERCGNSKDDDCSAGCDAAPGEGDAPCVDADGDGVPSDRDCDDSDPCRSPDIPEARNLCGHKAADWDSAATKACRDKLGGGYKPPLCGDKLDNDCDTLDAPCFVDEDCDGYAPPDDCDDTDAKVNSAAVEACDGLDNNCNGVKDEGCLPCDVDGDQHALENTSDPGCPFPADDPDDYDAGIHPGTTASDGGKEGGTVNGALRGLCGQSAEKNGAAARDVDHDGDGLAARDDGCPTTTCDGDGDGFEGSQCSPPASLLDCNDADAKVFPGAPDLCGDGIAQSCVTDGACTCDKDGDGYCPPGGASVAGDCDDNDKDIHPWALERCDKKDNDCDGLVDEGNPGADGAPISTATMLCNDDDDGKCGPLAGVCVCSPVKPNSTRDEGNRTACTGEDLTLAASPRCFGATQPQTERCDTDDWSCDSSPYTAGEIFVGKGGTCGTDTGACVAGTVEGCDPAAKSADPKIVDVLQRAGLSFSGQWICSKETRLPSAELCNGLDDDCDGFRAKSEVSGTDPGWPELDEADLDKDGYLACTGCDVAGLPPPLKGCGDCDDDRATAYPGAPELCNGKDDNCQAGVTDDGKDECAGTTCCTQQSACRDLKTDLKNCGACGAACPAASADACQGGECTCGGAPCVAPECQQASCTSGSCDVTDLPAKSPCQDGLCYNGSCCKGCWDDKNSCKDGTADKLCGIGGVSCVDCTGLPGSQTCNNHACN